MSHHPKTYCAFPYQTKWVTGLKRSSRFGVHNLLFLLVIGFLAGCQADAFREVETGSTQQFVPGYPNFNYSAWVDFDYTEQFIMIYASIPYQNLVFRSSGNGGFLGEAHFNLIITREEEGREPRTIFNRTFQKEFAAESYDETRSLHSYIFEQKLATEPGNYTATLIIDDRNSRKQTRQSRILRVPNFNEGGVHIGSVLLLRKESESGQFRPLSSYYLNESTDSLKTSLQVHLNEEIEEARLELHLIKFKADSLPARPPHFHTPMMGSLQYRGIQYEGADTLQTNIRYLDELTGTIDIDFLLPQLPRGNYRAEMIAYEKDEITFRRARDFAVMPPDFPSIKSIREMNEALAYITNPREYKALTEPKTPAELRNAFDAFWADLIGTRNRALATIQNYYSRVEEANNMFTTHKEGWKTDFGMVYILFGPPIYKERYVDGESWYYQLGTGSQTIRFYFERSRSAGYNSPVPNYVLHRDRSYEQFYFRVFEDWRRGAIR